MVVASQDIEGDFYRDGAVLRAGILAFNSGVHLQCGVESPVQAVPDGPVSPNRPGKDGGQKARAGEIVSVQVSGGGGGLPSRSTSTTTRPIVVTPGMSGRSGSLSSGNNQTMSRITACLRIQRRPWSASVVSSIWARSVKQVREPGLHIGRCGGTVLLEGKEAVNAMLQHEEGRLALAVDRVGGRGHALHVDDSQQGVRRGDCVAAAAPRYRGLAKTQPGLAVKSGDDVERALAARPTERTPEGLAVDRDHRGAVGPHILQAML